MDNYYDKMEKIWETNYPSCNSLKEVEDFYKEMSYEKSPQEIIDELMNRLPLKKVERILEFGCDNGIMLHYFKKYTKYLFGVDINAKSIKEGKQRFPNFDLRQNKGLEIPFEDNYFDIVFASAVLKHIRHEDRPTLYKEFKRVGRYFIVFEETVEKEKNVKQQGFTFYKTNFEEELSKNFNIIFQSKFKNELMAVYTK